MTNYEDEQRLGDAQAIIGITQQAMRRTAVEPGELYMVTTVDGGHEIVDTDAYADQPRRPVGSSTVYDVASFLAYVRKHQSGAFTEVWQDETVQTVTAVLDSHGGPSGPGWGQHRVTLRLRPSQAWLDWTGQSGKIIRQDLFAEFIEDHVADIIEPAAADMLELAQTFQATKGVDFESSKFLDSGHRQLVYKESVEAKAGKRGQIDIPNTFKIGVRPFLGMDPYRVTCRFRYRINDGDLALGYKLDRPDEVLRAAFTGVVEAIAEEIEQPIYAGKSW